MNHAESSTENLPAPAGAFATTHWSVVLAAGQEDSTQALVALEKLCRTYWYPLYAYVRRRGYSEPEAKDLTQSFFASFLKRHAIGRVKKECGTFRSYLLASLNHFLVNEYKREQAQKRGGGQPVISLDEQAAEKRYQFEPQETETPESLFERSWVATLLDGAYLRLQQKFEASNKGQLFEQLQCFIVAGAKGPPYAEVARSLLGITEEAVQKAVQRLRQRYQQVIREEIAQTVATTAEIEEELRYLRSLFSQ